MSAFSLTAQLRLQAPTNTSQVVSQIRQQLQGITVPINISVPPQAQRQLNNANKNLNQTAKAAKAAKDSVVGFGESAALAAKRFLAFSIAGGAIMRFAGTLSESAKEAIRFEREMNKIAQATGSSAKAVNAISNEISRLSTTFGVSSQDLAKASLILAQAGLSAKDTAKSLQALAKSDLAPTFDNIVDTTEGAIAVFNQFKVSADQLEGVLGSVNSVAAKFAVESGDIISAIRRTGGAFQAAGGNLNELMALFTSVRQTTRESADSIATGFRTIFARMQRVRTQNFLKTLGIDLQDIEGQFVGPYEAVRRLSLALKQLQGTDPRFAQIVEELGGFRQVSKVIPLIQQFDVAQKALNVSMAGSNSLSEDAARAQESLAVQIQKVKEQFYAMVRTMVGSSTFKAMATGALKLAEALIKIGTALTPLMPLLATLATFKLGQSIIPFFKGFKGKGGLGFAKGGLVPGEGNSDTVPAMLTPGEFVLTKKTTKNLGLHRGGQVQKFAKGGEVKYISSTSSKDIYDKIKSKDELKTFGAVILQGGPKGTASGKRNQVISDSAIMTIPGYKGQPDRLAKLEVKSLSAEASKSFTGVIDRNLVSLVPQLGKRMAAILGAKFSKFDPKTIKQIPNYDSLVGGLFETSLNSLGIPFDDVADNNKTFDFPQGFGNKGGLFNMSPDTQPVDAKKSWNSKTRASLAKKIQNWYKDNNISDMSSAVLKANANTISQFSTKKTASPGLKVDSKLLGTLPSGGIIDAKNYASFGIGRSAWDKREQLIAQLNAAAGSAAFALVPQVNPKTKQTSNVIKKMMATGGLVPKPAADMLERNLGDVRRARRRRLTEEGKLDPQAQEYARRRNKRFAERRGAVKVAQVFDFDDTLALTDAKDFRDFLGTRAKTFVDAARTTQYTLAAKQAAERGEKVFVLTVRDSDSKKPIQDFAARAGINLRTSDIITVADDPSLAGLREPGAKPGTTRKMSAASKKAVILQRLASQYEQIKFYDDNQENLLKAAGIKNVQTMLAQPKIAKFAKGGSVSDTVPAMLTPGEFVVNKDTVNSVGVATLEKLNQSKGRVQGFAQGGLVGGGGIGGIASVGFAMSAISGLLGNFDGLSDSTKKLIDTVSMAATQFGVLYMTIQSSSEYFNKYDETIAESTKKLEYLQPEATKAQSAYTDWKNKADMLRNKQPVYLRRDQAFTQAEADLTTRKTFFEKSYQGTDKQQKIDHATRLLARTQARKRANIAAYRENIANVGTSEALSRSSLADFESLKQQDIDERTKIAQAKGSQRLVSRLGIGAAIGGAIAQTGGSFLEERGRANIQANAGGESEFRTGRQLSTAGSWAGTGAAIGAAFGPIGMAVGGATGAILGFTKGLIDANKEIANLKLMRDFNQALERNTYVLDALSKEQTTFLNAQVAARQQAAQFYNSITDPKATKESKQDILSSSKAQLDKFSTYLNYAAKDVTKFDDFITKAGPDVFYMVAQLSNIPSSQLKEQFEKIVEANKKAKESTEKLTTVHDEYTTRIKNLISVSQAFDTASLNIQEFSGKLDVLMNLSDGVAAGFRIIDESARLGTPDKILDTKKFNEILSRDISNNTVLDFQFSDQLKPVGDALAQDISAVAKYTQDLPNILLNVRNNLDVFGQTDMIDQLMASFEDAPPLIRNAVEMAARNMIGAEGKGDALADKLRNDINGVQEEIIKGWQPTLESAQKISAESIKEANRRLEFGEKLNTVMLKEIELRNKNIDIQAQGEELMARAQQRPVNLDLMGSLDLQRQQNILGADAGLANNPEKIGLALKEAENKLQTQQNEINAAGINASQALLDSYAEQQRRVVRLNNALQHLADVGSRASVVMQKIEQLQIDAKFKQGIAEKLTFAETPRDLRDMGMQLAATRTAATAGTINVIPPQLRNEVLSMLDQIGDTALGVLGGQTGKKVKQDLVTQKLVEIGLPADDARRIAEAQSTDLQKQIEELNKIRESSEAAAEELRKANEDKVAKLVELDEKSTRAFANTIKSIFIQQDLTQLQSKEESAKSGIAANEKVLAARKKLEEKFGPNWKEIGNNFAEITNVKNLQFQKRQNERFANKYESGGSAQYILSETRKRAGYADMNMQDRMVASRDEANKYLANQGVTPAMISRFNDLLRERVGTGENLTSQSLFNALNDSFKALQPELKATYAGLDVAEAELRSKGIDPNDKALSNWGNSKNWYAKDFETANQNVKSNEELRAELAELNVKLGEYTSAISARTSALAATGMKQGGWVSGIGNRDSVPTMLTPGEFVLSRQMVQQIGKENVAQLADGGIVNPFLGDATMPIVKNKSRRQLRNEARRQRRLNLKASRSRFNNADPIDFVNMDESQVGDYTDYLGSGGNSKDAKAFAKFRNRSRAERIARTGAESNRQLQSNRDLERIIGVPLVATPELMANARKARLQKSVENVKKDNERAARARRMNSDLENMLGIAGPKTREEMQQRYEAKRQETLNNLKKKYKFASGSLVPGSGSGDKVPALLEPGEFVLNRNAVSAIGVGKLSHLNKKISRFNTGGSVKMQAGGMVGIDFSVMERAVRNFGSFVDKFASVANSMNGLQIQLMANHKVEVIINGAQVMVGLQDSIRNLVIGETNKAINKMLSQKFGLPPVDSALS